MASELVLFSGNANKSLSKKISQYLDIPLGEALVGEFSDGETRVELQANVRGAHVFILQPTCAPVNHHIMEAVIMVDACRRASAEQVTLVAPYYGYGRQERKSVPRTSITAKLVADLLVAAGVDRLLTVELHNAAIQGFFNIPVDHLFAKPIFCDYFKSAVNNLIVVSPDAGGVERARAIAKQMGCGLAIIDKRRDKPNESEVMNIVGDVNGKNCLVVDDIVDTAGSLIRAVEALSAEGAASVSAMITHPVLSGPALQRIQESELKELVVTDSIPLSERAKGCEKIVQVTLAELLAKAIRRVYYQDSVSSLFL